MAAEDGSSSSSSSSVEIPQYFICPISLQIMKDPVTVISGITYDRESIEQWISSPNNNKNNNTIIYCPVTKQVLPRDSDLTPNHTLRRLIQSWCIANASNGVDRIPTPKPSLSKLNVLKLIQDLWVPELQLKALDTLESLANERESNKRIMIGAGVATAMVSIIINCFNNDTIDGLQEAFNVLYLIKVPVNEFNHSIAENNDFFDSILWVVQRAGRDHKELRSHAVSILKSSLEFANSNQLERLKPEFYGSLLWVLRDSLGNTNLISQEAIKAALQVLLETCTYGRNRVKIIEVGAVCDLIEIELSGQLDKRTTELIFGILDHLCCCADGRAQFLAHAAGIAVVSKRILRVSPTVNDLAVKILSSICMFSGTDEVVQEMLRVGAVSKLCMILQAEGSQSVKEKAREVLRLHSNVWSNSPCIATYLLTRYPR